MLEMKNSWFVQLLAFLLVGFDGDSGQACSLPHLKRGDIRTSFAVKSKGDKNSEGNFI
jgi:hypothetical protein